jgi:hypothetical protein
MLDLTKLTPAPWRWVKEWEDEDGLHWGIDHPTYHESCVWPLVLLATDDHHAGNTDMAFIALARNAFDVMMRRGWWPVPCRATSEWWVAQGRLGSDSPIPFDDRQAQVGKGCPTLAWPDPFTALVEADRWYAENVEKTTRPGPAS